MWIINLIGLILTVLRSLPQIIQIVRAIIELMSLLKNNPDFDEKQAIADFRDALKQARDEKNTEKLEALHKRLVDAYRKR